MYALSAYWYEDGNFDVLLTNIAHKSKIRSAKLGDEVIYFDDKDIIINWGATLEDWKTKGQSYKYAIRTGDVDFAPYDTLDEALREAIKRVFV
jgi:hypothetical protein